MSADRSSADNPAAPPRGRQFPTRDANVATTISHDFIDHVRLLFDLSLQDVAKQPLGQWGVNPPSRHALPAFVSAAASVECFTNEHFISEMARFAKPDSALFQIQREWEGLEKLELWPKLVLIANLGFKQHLADGKDPWNKLRDLMKIRNDLVHYKMSTTRPKYMQDFVQKKIALHAPGDHLYGWTYQLGTPEAIRWAHNAACETVAAIAKLDPSRAHFFETLTKMNFRPLSKNDRNRRLVALGVELPKGK